MTYDVKTVDAYLKAIPEERQNAFSRLRSVILENLPEGFEETISYKMPSYVVTHSRYPPGYHCNPEIPLPFLSIASQKNFIAFYHIGIYAKPELLNWFESAYAGLEIGKLDMGKSCIRFKKMEAIPFDLLGELTSKISVNEWIEMYERETNIQGVH